METENEIRDGGRLVDVAPVQQSDNRNVHIVTYWPISFTCFQQTDLISQTSGSNVNGFWLVFQSDRVLQVKWDLKDPPEPKEKEWVN